MKNMSLKESITTQEEWDLIIRPQRSWWDLRLGELWRYRDLIRLFVWRDFVAYYKQTILGPLWYLIQPILTTLVFTRSFLALWRVSALRSVSAPFRQMSHGRYRDDVRKM